MCSSCILNSCDKDSITLTQNHFFVLPLHLQLSATAALPPQGILQHQLGDIFVLLPFL